jgi:hypothetical protein
MHSRSTLYAIALCSWNAVCSFLGQGVHAFRRKHDASAAFPLHCSVFLSTVATSDELYTLPRHHAPLHVTEAFARDLTYMY